MYTYSFISCVCFGMTHLIFTRRYQMAHDARRPWVKWSVRVCPAWTVGNQTYILLIKSIHCMHFHCKRTRSFHYCLSFIRTDGCYWVLLGAIGCHLLITAWHHQGTSVPHNHSIIINRFCTHFYVNGAHKWLRFLSLATSVENARLRSKPKK